MALSFILHIFTYLSPNILILNRKGYSYPKVNPGLSESKYFYYYFEIVLGMILLWKCTGQWFYYKNVFGDLSIKIY